MEIAKFSSLLRETRDKAGNFVSLKSTLFTVIFLITLSALFVQNILMNAHGTIPEHDPQFVYPEKAVLTIDLVERIDPSHLTHSDIPEVEDRPVPTHEIKHISTPAVDGLFEETPFGQIPIRRVSDGMTIFEAYKAPFIPQVDVKGIISLVVLDYGLSSLTSQAALSELPPSVSFVASPYAADLQHQIDSAKSSSHEVWLDLPVQLHDFAENDTGPLTLMSGLNTTQNKSRLYRALSLAHGYAGIVFQGTPAFDRSNMDGFVDILTDLSQRGIGIASIENHSGAVEKQIKTSSAPNSSSNILLDASEGDLLLLKSLEELERKALSDYVVVAFVSAQPEAFRVIKDWEKGLAAKKLQLAPLSEAIRQQKD